MILLISKMSNYLCETDYRWLAGAWSIGTEICETVSLVAGGQCDHIPHAGSLQWSILNVVFARGKGMFRACQFTSEISSMIEARHEFATDRRHPSMTVGRAGLVRGMAGISIGPLATDTSRF
jgi:hypothetical protein